MNNYFCQGQVTEKAGILILVHDSVMNKCRPSSELQNTASDQGVYHSSWGWTWVAKVSCISHHCGVQLILAYSWARPAILVAGKGKVEIAGLCRYFDPVTLTYIPCSSD